MSKKFLVPIDMNQLEVQNMRMQNLASAPASPVKGQIYYNTTTNKAMVWDGSNWIPWEVGASIQPASNTPQMDGTAAVGTSVKYAREDHVHPSDTTKVDKVSGKGLSTNDYTTTDKNKLAGIEAGAQVNDPVDTAMSSSSTNAVQNKVIKAYVDSAVGAVDAMRFKGTIGTGGDVTTLPTSGVKVGDTYRVITAGTYAGETCEVGDLIIATATTPTWTVAQTNIDGAITDVETTGNGNAVTSVTKNGNKITANKGSTFLTSHRTYTQFTGKPTANATPGFGDTVTISQISQSTTGQVSGTGRTITIPNATATYLDDGLFSHNDKAELDDLITNLAGVKNDIAILNAGQTSVVVHADIVSYTAYDETTDEEVCLDVANNGNTTTFSIAQAYGSDIDIRYLGIATA